MREGWEYRKLGEVCKINSGKSIKASFISGNNIDFKIPCYGGNGLRGFVEYPNHQGGKPIIGRVGALCGNVHYSSIPFYATEHALVVTIQDSAIYDMWLCRILESMKLGNYAEGAAQPVIAASKLLELEISIPPLSEQQRIVTYLDSSFAKIDEMKANAAKALSEAKALFQAELKKCMEKKEGWEEKRLTDICSVVTDFVAAGSFASLRENVKYIDTPDYAQLVRTMDLKSKFSKGTMVYVNEHAFNYLYRVNMNEECIVLPNVGVNCGEVYYVTPALLPYKNNVLGPNAILVKSNTDSNSFLSYLFQGDDFQKKLHDITSHMAQPKFNKTALRALTTFIPSLQTQHLIVTHLDTLSQKVQELERNYNTILAECDAMKQAILKEVFE